MLSSDTKYYYNQKRGFHLSPTIFIDNKENYHVYTLDEYNTVFAGDMGYIQDHDESGRLVLVPVPESMLDPLTLDEEKTKKLFELKQARRECEYGGMYINGVLYDTEEKDELRLNSISKLFDKGILIDKFEGYKIADGSYIDLTKAEVDYIAGCLLVHYQMCFQKEREYIKEITKLETIKEIQDFKIEFHTTSFQTP